MKLTDICSNEKFIKGELYASRDYSCFIFNKNGIINWIDKNKNTLKFGKGDSGFYIKEIVDNDWKLYEFIDDKMVEYVPETKMLQPLYITGGNPAIGDKDYIMQPTEAIRWMRENRGKIIYRDEGNKLEFFCFNAKVKVENFYKYNKSDIGINNIPKNFEHSSWELMSITEVLLFSAYTYRIVEE